MHYIELLFLLQNIIKLVKKRPKMGNLYMFFILILYRNLL